MLDDLRNSSFLDEEEETQAQESTAVLERPARRKPQKKFLGMTAQERFILSLMLFLLVCAFSVLALFVTEKMVLPFF